MDYVLGPCGFHRLLPDSVRSNWVLAGTWCLLGHVACIASTANLKEIVKT